MEKVNFKSVASKRDISFRFHLVFITCTPFCDDSVFYDLTPFRDITVFLIYNYVYKIYIYIYSRNGHFVVADRSAMYFLLLRLGQE